MIGLQTTPEHEALLNAIREAPLDDAPRLIYADYLDDLEQPERASFIRIQIEEARLYSLAIPYQEVVKFGRKKTEKAYLNAASLSKNLQKKFAQKWLRDCNCRGLRECWCRWTRGFVTSVSTRMPQWMKYGSKIVNAPVSCIEYVTFGDKTPAIANGYFYSWWNESLYVDRINAFNVYCDLPDSVWKVLPRFKSESQGWRSFRNRQEASSALSTAALRFAWKDGSLFFGEDTVKCKNEDCINRAVRWYGWDHEGTLVKAPFCQSCVKILKSAGRSILPLDRIPAKKLVPWWIKERRNPEIGVYYSAVGQMLASRARRIERVPVHGVTVLHRFDTESEYADKIATLRASGYRVD